MSLKFRPIKIICLILPLLLPLSAQGQSAVELSEIGFTQLCGYEPRCISLKHANGSFRKPKRTILIVFQQIRQLVLEVAARFSVDPRVLVAVITTEHTLNVSIDDVIQDIYSRTPIGRDGRFLGIGISYGFGQIYADAAESAEPIVAEIERRLVLPRDQVAQRLQTMEGALTYAAGLLLHAQRLYASAGFTIEHRPGVLATLYNIGRVHERLDRTLREKRLPGVNYFGWFVEQNWLEFHNAIFAQPTAPIMSSEDYEAERIRGGRGFEDHYPIYFIDDAIPLFVQPDECRTNIDSGDSRVDAYRSVLERYSNPKPIQGRGKFNILQQALGCQGEVWALARFSRDGAMGWFRQDDVGQSLAFRYEAKTCKRRDYTACLAAVREVVGDADFLQFDPTNGIVTLKILGFTERPERNFRAFEASCFRPENRRAGHENLAATLREIDALSAAARRGEYTPQRPRTTVFQRMGREGLLGEQEYWYRGEELAAIQRRVDALERSLDTVRLFPDSRVGPQAGAIGRLWRWVHAFRFHCKEHGCVGPKPDVLEAYFAGMDLQRLRSSEHLQAMLESYAPMDYFTQWFWADTFPGAKSGDLPLRFFPSLVETLADHRYDAMSALEQWQSLEDSCRGILAQDPVIAAEWQKLREAVVRHQNKAYSEDIWFYSSDIVNWERWCVAMQAYYPMLRGERPFAPIQLNAPCDPFCYIRVEGRRVAVGSLHFFQPSYEQLRQTFADWARKWIEDFDFVERRYVEDQSRLNSGQLGSRQIQQVFDNRRNCLFNPVATIDRIKKLLELPCVDQVLVPNESHLLAEFGKPNGRGTLVVMPELDRFQITIKPRCLEGPTADIY